ncbi:hypothetical protein QJS10_CPB21g00300 [Acorus calamus]|uniref:Glycosyl transferase family 1 domain-containing protein n=2 Tax=Acorus calamus TaxID=4465 RepID=A0AAV9C4K6_ACOCL|nr:hypothetical protein QJS10_CPB21g00300 [Acorus calamus]
MRRSSNRDGSHGGAGDADGDDAKDHPLNRRARAFRFARRWWSLHCCCDPSARGLFVVIGSLSLIGLAVNVFLESMFATEKPQIAVPVERNLSALKFVPLRIQQRIEMRDDALDRLREEERLRIYPPRLALVLGSLRKDPTSLMLYSVSMNLQKLGYILTIYAVEDGETHSLWEHIGCQVFILSGQGTHNIDWSSFQGVISSSLEAKELISSLMEEPFCSVPLIWIIHEDTLGKRLPIYASRGSQQLINEWRKAFSRADVVVFPDFSLPMLYSTLDTGNFFVIPGTPVDVWTAERYMMTHSRHMLRKINGFSEDDLIVVIIGNSFSYNMPPREYETVMNTIGPWAMEHMQTDQQRLFKFLFICGNADHGAALQIMASRVGLPNGSVFHYSFDDDVNSILLMANIILYGSFQDEQGFSPLLVRAMCFEIPIVVPDLPTIREHVVDKVHGMVFKAKDPHTMISAFSHLISGKELSSDANSLASSGVDLVRNMFAPECITSYAKLLENILYFPSVTMLPKPSSQIKPTMWMWKFFKQDVADQHINVLDGTSTKTSSIVYTLEEELQSQRDISEDEMEYSKSENLTPSDWDDLRQIEILEELERRELWELGERMEKSVGVLDNIRSHVKRVEKSKFEENERDEGELVRTGQPLCIYEIYRGTGAWPFLHSGALYRGISLSKIGQRPISDDIDAVGRLPILNETDYSDVLGEVGGMFAVADKIDALHKPPWIGFQSWRAAGKKVALSIEAENVLREIVGNETNGDIIYYWASMDLGNTTVDIDVLDFWSVCDSLNAGNCRTVFEDSFRQMYNLPHDMPALPYMPSDGDLWSILNSWVMPTPSFLEFMMFSRLFVDSLDLVNRDKDDNHLCLLGSTKLERKQCYTRVMELLVNVWAYHSARKMVYMDPTSGKLEEQYPVDLRKGLMWVMYFNTTLLKHMDEDLAEAALDRLPLRKKWLWPHTGEIHNQGVFDKERENKYRRKQEKKRRIKAKQLERKTYGYKQKAIGGA